MKTSGVLKWILAVGLIAGCRGAVLAAETNANSQESAAVELGKCKITILSAYAWRDWMPIVDHPGPDGGSPLLAKVILRVDNPGRDAIKLSYRAVILDEKGQSHAAAFNTMPNFRVLPDAIAESYRNLDEKGRKEANAKYNVMWDGSLMAGESRLVEIITGEGRYLPVGSRIRVEIKWTDSKGESVVVRTPEAVIERTD